MTDLVAYKVGDGYVVDAALSFPTSFTPAHSWFTTAATGGSFVATATADGACGQLASGWVTTTHDGYNVVSTTDMGMNTVTLKIVANSEFDLTKALNALQATLVPTDAPPLTERQLELFPAVLELDVNRDDIFSGIRGNVHECAVARAVARRFDGAHVSVGGYEVRVWDPETNTPIVYRPTGEMSEFIRRFDHGDPVSSTRFRLERVNEARGEFFA